MTKTQYRNNIASSRRHARRSGWSLAKVDAAQQCAAMWACESQFKLHTNEDEWRNEAANTFLRFTEGKYDGYWQECVDFNGG